MRLVLHPVSLGYLPRHFVLVRRHVNYHNDYQLRRDVLEWRHLHWWDLPVQGRVLWDLLQQRTRERRRRHAVLHTVLAHGCIDRHPLSHDLFLFVSREAPSSCPTQGLQHLSVLSSDSPHWNWPPAVLERPGPGWDPCSLESVCRAACLRGWVPTAFLILSTFI